MEPIDAVRFIANRSSGKLGIALAAAARDAGWQVTLLLGPVSAEPPRGITTVRFESGAELESLLKEHFPKCDVLVMAAAVADYRPARPSAVKLERSAGAIRLELEATPDLVAQCAAGRTARQRIVGFALEEQAQLAARAMEKLQRKGLDAIVANPLATMGSGEITGRVYTPDGKTFQPSPACLDKPAFARWLIGWIDQTLLAHPSKGGGS